MMSSMPRLAFSLLLALLLATAPGAAAESFRALYQEGVAAFQRGDLVAATQQFERALAQQPGHPGTVFALAQGYQALFERTGLFYAEAVARYRQVLDGLDDTPADSPRQMARLFLGQLQVHGGEYAAALEPLQQFLTLRPQYYAAEEVWNALGVAFYYLNRYQEAVRAFEQALSIAPEFAAARFNLRSVFTRLALFDSVMANRRLQRLDVALEGVDQLLALAPRYLAARYQRATLLRDLQRGGEAEREARNSLALGGDDKTRFEFHELLGDLLAGRGAVEDALVEYYACLRIFPGYLQMVEKIDRLAPPAAPAKNAARPAPSFDRDAVQQPLQFPM